jgi:glycosyltransferase involved in cell wall biosynthesis
MPEYIDDGVNGIIVPPDDVGGLAEALIELLSDTNKRKSFGKSAREKAVNKFNGNEVAKEITSLYHKAISLFNNTTQKG